MLIWGNHSLKIYPDISYCEIDGKPAIEVPHNFIYYLILIIYLLLKQKGYK